MLHLYILLLEILFLFHIELFWKILQSKFDLVTFNQLNCGKFTTKILTVFLPSSVGVLSTHQYYLLHPPRPWWCQATGVGTSGLEQPFMIQPIFAQSLLRCAVLKFKSQFMVEHPFSLPHAIGQLVHANSIHKSDGSHSFLTFSSVQFSHSVVSDSLWPHELQHATPPCPSPTPRVHSDSGPLSRWYHPAISSSVVPFSSCPQSLPASESFPISQLFPWGGQSTGVSALASFLPMNTQDWSPLGWTDWISLQSKGLSGVFSNTTVQKHHLSLHSPTLTSIHDHRKNYSLDYTNLCWQSNVSAFEYAI